MLRIVLPITLSLAIDVPVKIVVLVVIIIVIDFNVAVVPIAVAPMAAPRPPGGGTERHSRTPHQSRAWIVTGISIGIVRICGGRCTVNDSRIVRRDVNYVGIGLLNLNHLLARSSCTTPDCFGFHNLL